MTLTNFKDLNTYARIISLFTLSFVLFILINHLIENDFGQFNSLKEKILFLFFPVGICLGQVISWKLELTGGVITVLSLALFHAIEKSLVFSMIDILAFPGILFIISAFLKKKYRR